MARGSTGGLDASAGIVQSLDQFLPALEKALPEIVRTTGESAPPGQVRIRLAKRSGFLVFVKPTGGDFEINVPLGLVLRHIALLRLLLPYWNDRIIPRVLGSPLDQYDPNEFHVPPAVAPIFEDAEGLEELVAGLERVRFPRALKDPDQWTDIALMSRYALMFLVFHELTHAAGRHGEVRALAATGHRLAEFGLSTSDVLLATELVADVWGAQLLTHYFVLYPHTETFGECAELYGPRLGFAIAALFALCDHRRKMLHASLGTDYPPGVTRNEFFKGYSPLLLEEDPELQQQWSDCIVYGSDQCVSAIEKVSGELVANCRTARRAGQEFYLIGSLVYGREYSRPYIARNFAEHEALLRRFSRWVDVVRPEIESGSRG